MPNTKIVATLGPSSDSPDVIRALLTAGVNVFRLNASHGTVEAMGQRIGAVRAISAEMGLYTGLLLDLQGPKIRLGTFESGRATLKTGDAFTITTQQVSGSEAKACTTYAEFAGDVRPGDRVLLNDGAVELRALSNDGVEVRFEVVSGGEIGDRKGINLPGVKVSAPSLTRKDIADLQYGLEMDVDYVALSFVRTATDVMRLRFLLEEREIKIPIVAKIEKPEACLNLDAILAEADGVMVARGDLGIELALEKVPNVQKSIIRKARAAGKFVITATQMLETMMEKPYPTRAEVSDIANAIYDGTDAVMLSGETAAGRYPVEAAAMMAKIATETELNLKRAYADLDVEHGASTADIIADAAFRSARASQAKSIVVFTMHGGTARLVAKYRPPVPVIAITPFESAARQMAVLYGVTPLIDPEGGSTDELIARMEVMLRTRGLVRSGDLVVITSGQPIGRPGTTNMIKIHRIS
jgi:pyruvate kinase